jgi:multiple sugar transport system permease protein
MARPHPLLLTLRWIAIVVASIIALFPIYWMVTMAFKPRIEWTSATGKVYWWPENPTLDNFRSIFVVSAPASGLTVGTETTVIGPLVNSLIAGVGGTLLAVAVGTLCAYGISRYAAGGTRLPFSILQLRMFPPIAIMVPVVIQWSALKLIDKWYGLVLIYGVVTFPFAVWLMKSFFDDIPRELDEAAVVDGASNWGAFRKVVLPLAKGGLATTALFIFILNWSDFLVAFLLTTKDMITIPVFLNKLVSSQTGQQFGPQAAVGVIAAIPPVIFGVLIQRYLVRGLTFGAIKR